MLRRRLPHGLFAPIFFLDRRDPRHHIHLEANLRMRGPWPLPVWVLVQIWLAARWRWVFASRETEKALTFYGPVVEAAEGLPRAEQERIVLGLARRFCIPPGNVYEYRLYREPDAALDYIFDTESMGMDLVGNGSAPGPDHADLQDKVAFTARISRIGLPCAPILAQLERGAPADLAALVSLDAQGVFLKSRSGFRGMGAFALWATDDGLEGLMHDGRALRSSGEAAAALDALLATDSVLVQPLLRDHPILASAASSGNAISLRVVTCRRPEGAEILAALLRISMRLRGPSDRIVLVDVVPGVDLKTGRIWRNPNSILALHPQTRLVEDQAFRALPEDPVVPFWPDIAAHSRRAQAEFSGLWAVGWDWLVTDKGPVLLEGNVHWDKKKPQQVAGGLVPAMLTALDT